MGLFSFLSRKKKSLGYSARTALQPLQTPNKTGARKRLKRIAKSFRAAESRHGEFLLQLQKCKDLSTNKESQEAVISFLKEVRQLTDALEICLILLISDFHKVDFRKPIRPFLERALNELQKAMK